MPLANCVLHVVPQLMPAGLEVTVPLPLPSLLKDTALTQLLETAPASEEDAFQHAVASELLVEREGMKTKIGQEGVQLIDVHPEELSLAAVNRYLEIKSRGVL